MTIFFDANQNHHVLPPNEKIFWRISGYPLVQLKNKILMVVPTWNTMWELPGGGIELAESISDGIIRECYEETGYKIKLLPGAPLYVGEMNFLYTRHHAKKFFHSLIMVYQAKITSKKLNVHIINTMDGNEIQKVEWVALNKLNKKNCHPTVYPAIKLLQKVSRR